MKRQVLAPVFMVGTVFDGRNEIVNSSNNSDMTLENEDMAPVFVPMLPKAIWLLVVLYTAG